MFVYIYIRSTHFNIRRVNSLHSWIQNVIHNHHNIIFYTILSPCHTLYSFCYKSIVPLAFIIQCETIFLCFVNSACTVNLLPAIMEIECILCLCSRTLRQRWIFCQLQQSVKLLSYLYEGYMFICKIFYGKLNKPYKTIFVMIIFIHKFYSMNATKTIYYHLMGSTLTKLYVPIEL